MFKLPSRFQSPLANIRALYDGFDAPVTFLDCGQKCAPHNPNGKPFCCDIAHAAPAVYKQEWAYLQPNTDLWREYHDETGEEIPENMLLLACLGPQSCLRPFRSLSCRQFPFFPYVTADYRFVGLSYYWEFESRCWVISNLGEVTETYRREFIATYDRLFALEQNIFDDYAYHSERMRTHFADQRRRIPLLHRNGGYFLISPGSERISRVDVAKMPKFGVYK
jgi:hypothetical protein